MKHSVTKFIISFLFMGIIALVSCSKSEVAGGGNTTPDIGTTAFVINGQNYTSDSVFVTTSNGYRILKAYQNITSATQGKLIAITFSSLAVGTYTLSPMPPNSVNITIGSTVNYTSQSGTLSITSNNGSTISGNFNTLVEGGEPFSGSFADVKIR